MWLEPQPRWGGGCSVADDPFGGSRQRSSVGTQSGGGCEGGVGAVCVWGGNSSPLSASSLLGPLWPHALTRCQLLHQAEKRRERPRARPRRTPEGSDAVLETGPDGWQQTAGLGSGGAVGPSPDPGGPLTRSLNPRWGLFPCWGRFTDHGTFHAQHRSRSSGSTGTGGPDQREARPDGESSEPLTWVKALFPDQNWTRQQ